MGITTGVVQRTAGIILSSGSERTESSRTAALMAEQSTRGDGRRDKFSWFEEISETEVQLASNSATLDHQP